MSGNLDSLVETWIQGKISLKHEIERIKKILTHKEVKMFLVGAILFTMTPSLSSAFNFYYSVELKFDLASMSSIGFVSAIGYFVSIIALNFFFTEVSFKRFYLSTGCVILLLNMSVLILLFKMVHKLQMSNVTFVYLMNTLMVFANELNFLPLLGLCVRLCPKDLEGTTYGVLTSLFNLGYYFATIIASLLLMIFRVSTKRLVNQS